MKYTDILSRSYSHVSNTATTRVYVHAHRIYN